MVPAYDKTGFYTVNSNIDVERLNAIHSARGVPYPFGFSNLLLGIGNTNMDCFLSANLKSELDIDPRYASAYKTRMNTSINRILNRTSEITSFSQDVAYGFMSIGQAFEKGTITVQELLEILNNKNAVKFREWVANLPADSHLVGEFINECEERLKDGRYIKIERITINMLLAASSLIAGSLVPAAAGAAWTVLDTFVLDKISQGWTPKIFTDKILRKDILQ